MNWNDLKLLLTFYRAGSLMGAADRLSLNPTTLSRRLNALQAEMGVSLLEKSSDGSLSLTKVGQQAAQHAETAETAFGQMESELTGGMQTEEGTVRISSVPAVTNRLLIPRVREFTWRHPGIELHLASEVRNISMTKREADMAIRLGRPREGGFNVRAKRIGALKHAVYCSRQLQGPDTRWVLYHEAMAFLPQARWMQKVINPAPSEISSIRPGDLEGVIEAVAAGEGRSPLPVMIADADHRLERLPKPVPEFEREIWLLQHADTAGLARMRAVSTWLEQLFGA